VSRLILFSLFATGVVDTSGKFTCDALKGFWGDDSWKNLKQKILCHCPFNKLNLDPSSLLRGAVFITHTLRRKQILKICIYPKRRTTSFYAM
jgi:hypothetical protein